MSVKLSICVQLKNASSSSCASDISMVHVLTGKSSLQSGWNLRLLTNFWLFFWLCYYCHCRLSVNFNLKVKLCCVLKPLTLCNVDFSEWGWRPLHHILRQTYEAYCKQKTKREIYVRDTRQAFNCQVFPKKIIHLSDQPWHYTECVVIQSEFEDLCSFHYKYIFVVSTGWHKISLSFREELGFYLFDFKEQQNSNGVVYI